MTTFINYQGSKKHFTKKFNFLISNTKHNTYIEPFVGSGAVLFNLDKRFDNYIINDLNEHVIFMYNTFKTISYDDVLDANNDVLKNFGYIKQSKESFYAFRDFYNEKHHFSNNKEKGIYLYFLANSCINSMLRFGPNGMNSCFGERFKIMSKNDFEHIHRVLQDTTILNKDYRDVLQDNAVIFLDPPYFERPTSYSSNFDAKDLQSFLDEIKSLQSDIVYTDIYSEKIKEYLDWPHQETKVITNSSPYAYNDKHQEVAFYNFELPNDEW